jgi:hypothetical protein
MVIVNGERYLSPEDLDELENREEVIELPETSEDLIIIREREE